jgi:predicted DsbA family dithiol-disulfide isomerase
MVDSDPERLTVYSDYVCPFCYLGRASLDRYQATRERPLRIDWHPFDLRADRRGPDGAIDPDAERTKGEDYYEQARENVRRLRERYDVEMVQELAGDVDSLPAQLVSFHLADAVDYEDWLAFDEAVFDALWAEGRDVGDPTVLADLAGDCGLAVDVESVLADDGLREAVREQFAAARQQGVTGVPTFAYGEYAARGAVPPEQLERLVEG